MKFRITVHDDTYRVNYDSYRAAAKAVDPFDTRYQRDNPLAAAITRQVTQAEQELKEFACRWFKGEEYVTIEFDTEANTATVIPVKE